MRKLFVGIAAAALLALGVPAAFAGGIYVDPNTGECTFDVDVDVDVETSMRIKVISTTSIELGIGFDKREPLHVLWYGTLPLGGSADVNAQFEVTAWQQTGSTFWFKMEWSGLPSPGHVHWNMSEVNPVSTPFQLATYNQGDPMGEMDLEVWAGEGSAGPVYYAGNFCTGVLTFTITPNP